MKKWNSVAIYYDILDSILANSVLGILEDIQQKNLISRFIFTRSLERGENLLLLLELIDTSAASSIKEIFQKEIKLYFESFPAAEKQIQLPVNDWFLPYPNNHIEYNENFIFDVMETGGVQAAEAAIEILSQSSKIVSGFIQNNSDEWTPETAFGPGLQLHLGLVQAFCSNLNEVYNFYSYFFESILEMVQLPGDDAEESKNNLLMELKESFEEQKEGLSGYINYITETILNNEHFDEEWMNEWIIKCKNVSHKIFTIQNEGRFVPPENYAYNSRFDSSEEQQEKWPVLVYLLRFINCQMNILGVYELNLVYSLKEGCSSCLV